MHLQTRKINTIKSREKKKKKKKKKTIRRALIGENLKKLLPRLPTNTYTIYSVKNNLKEFCQNFGKALGKCMSYTMTETFQSLTPRAFMKIKINLNFYFHTSLWCLKSLYESL